MERTLDRLKRLAEPRATGGGAPSAAPPLFATPTSLLEIIVENKQSAYTRGGPSARYARLLADGFKVSALSRLSLHSPQQDSRVGTVAIPRCSKPPTCAYTVVA